MLDATAIERQTRDIAQTGLGRPLLGETPQRGMPWLGLAYYQAYATLRCKEGLLHQMGILADQGIADVCHYAPLHYLPFVVRSRSLMCKPSLAAAGFNPSQLPLDVVRAGCGP